MTDWMIGWLLLNVLGHAVFWFYVWLERRDGLREETEVNTQTPTNRPTNI